jgi:hypothetical protein
MSSLHAASCILGAASARILAQHKIRRLIIIFNKHTLSINQPQSPVIQ